MLSDRSFGRALASAFAITSALVASPPLSAQSTAADSAGLRLAPLYAIAARANPRVAAAAALARATAARVPGASRPPDPQLQLGLMNRSLPGLGPMDPLGMTQLQLMQMIPTAGKLRLAGAAAEGRANAATARAEDTRWEVRGRVAEAFYDVYRSERAITIAQATRQLLEETAATADAMYRVGESAQADVLKARVEVAKMTEELVGMRAMRLIALATLGGLLEQTFDSSTAPAVLPLLPKIIPSLDELTREAVIGRPMIRAGEADLTAAEADTRRAYREIWPDLQVGLQYGTQGRGDRTERMGSLMLGASIPVFAQSRQLRMRDEANAMQAMTAADVAAARADTRARVAASYVAWTKARNLGELYRTTILPQTGAAVSASLAAYRVGKVNLMTLLDNQMTVNRYSQELSALESAEGMALADLELLLGRALYDPNTGRLTPEGNR